MTPFSELLRAAREREPASFDALWTSYRRYVRSVVSRRMRPLLRPGYDSEDLEQSVFLEVLRELPRFEDRGEACFRHWLAIKAESKVRAKLRKALRGHDTPPTQPLRTCDRPDVPAPLGPVVRTETRAALDTALDLLDPIDRAVLRLRHEQGLSYAEIAPCAGLPSDEAVRKRHARALLRLRAALAPDVLVEAS